MAQHSLYNLLSAVLSRSIQDYVHGMSPREQRQYARMVRAEAAEWFFSESREPNSFLWLCDQLGIRNPNKLRDCLKAARREVDRKKKRKNRAKAAHS